MKCKGKRIRNENIFTKKQWGAASIAGRFSKQPEYNTVNEIGLSKIEIGLGTQLGRFGKKNG
jgi:hypothetical protein